MGGSAARVLGNSVHTVTARFDTQVDLNLRWQVLNAKINLPTKNCFVDNQLLPSRNLSADLTGVITRR